MASDFVRNIKDVRNIDILSPNITTENDLISTSDGEVYVVTNKGYRKITGVETKEIKQLKTDVSNVKKQSDTNTLNISNLTYDIETNTSEIKDLKTTTNNNTSEIKDLKTTTNNNTSEIKDLKTTTNNNTSEIKDLKTNKLLLFEGSASSTGDIIKLNQSYKDFTELKIKVKRAGANQIFDYDAESDTGISINHSNVFSYKNNILGKFYEMTIDKTSSTELKITSQTTLDTTGATSEDSGITILKVWGVK